MDDTFRRLPSQALSEITYQLQWDPLVAPGSLSVAQLSSLHDDERLKWLDAHREDLKTEVCRVGSHSFGNLKTYAEVVLDLARKLGLDPSRASRTPEVEEMVFDKILSDTRKRLTKDQWNEILSAAESVARQHGKTLARETTGFGLLAAAQMSGFGVYLLGSTLLGAISGALGLGLGFGAFTGLSSAISAIIGPIGWGVLGLFAAFKLAAPNYKKILPVVITVVMYRKLLESQEPAVPPTGSWLFYVWLIVALGLCLLEFYFILTAPTLAVVFGSVLVGFAWGFRKRLGFMLGTAVNGLQRTHSS